MRRYIAIDIGGTAIKFAVLDDEAAIVFHHSVATPKGQVDIRIPEAVYGIIDRLRFLFEGVAGVGISTAGVVDPASGEIVYAGETMPNYAGTNLKHLIESRYGIPTVVTNDVNAAALGERWKGAAQNCDHFFCVAIGTGIGGALFSGGRLVTGHSSRAGEIGHTLYDKATDTTYEQRASMSALMKQAAHELPNFVGGGRELFEQARAGDEACLGLIERWAEQIARGLAEVVLMIDPALIVIGGAVSEQREFLLDRIQAHMNDYLPEGFSKTRLTAAELGNRAALMGAVYPYYNEQSESEHHDNRNCS
ncbi:ROK family protein [Paenibacillus xylaniclasticus]|uniref:ROK family protein n=1 Tax=Paenibacillus xylaniclasticus TaxID=588083 RepID=UPI000FD6C6F8|nr:MULTISPECIES: ROK family protein [Paenibacillus]GFN30019.1 glucokinase [Paenibacillus curdlanolyticus]